MRAGVSPHLAAAYLLILYHGEVQHVDASKCGGARRVALRMHWHWAMNKITRWFDSGEQCEAIPIDVDLHLR